MSHRRTDDDHVSHREKEATCELQTEASEETGPADLTLDFQSLGL